MVLVDELNHSSNKALLLLQEPVVEDKSGVFWSVLADELREHLLKVKAYTWRGFRLGQEPIEVESAPKVDGLNSVLRKGIQILHCL